MEERRQVRYCRSGSYGLRRDKRRFRGLRDSVVVFRSREMDLHVEQVNLEAGPRSTQNCRPAHRPDGAHRCLCPVNQEQLSSSILISFLQPAAVCRPLLPRAGHRCVRPGRINSLVLDIARTQFTYLNDTPARVEVALGDGRLLLESELASGNGRQFDILVMDAFSGDSVPVHLVTREAFQTYFRRLKPGGILAVNVTNSYLDLVPVMERAANAFGKVAMIYRYVPELENEDFCFDCAWTLIMDRATMAAHPELQAGAEELLPKRPFRIWTDDFSNMYGILK